MVLSFVPLTEICNTINVFAEENDTVEYATGCIPDDEELLKSRLIDSESIQGIDSLPTSVDLTHQLPIPGNQGSQGSCIGWAVGYALKSHQESVEHEWGLNTSATLFSPSYIYNQMLVDSYVGTKISDALNLVTTDGVCTLSDMPYDESVCSDQPNYAQKKAASNFRASNWYMVNTVEGVKAILASGNGVVIEVETYPDFDNIGKGIDGNTNELYDEVSGTSRGSHAICLIGYNDSFYEDESGNDKGAFKFINSWGTTWGFGGYGYISYDLFIEQSEYGYVLEDETQHYETKPSIVKTQYEINVYSDSALTNLIGTIPASTEVCIEEYIAANNGIPPALKINDGYITAKTEATIPLASSTTTIYNGPINNTEIGVYELGKSISGAKLRFTYTSDSAKDIGVVGIAARRNDSNWTWLQSEAYPALLSDGEGVETVVKMTYDEFESLADVDETNLKNFIFQDWGLAEGTNLKIELIASIGEEVTEVYNDSLTEVKISPYELGKSVENSLIRFTYTSSQQVNDEAISFVGIKSEDELTNEISFCNLYSRGPEKQVVATFTYEDLINYLGFTDDIVNIEIKNLALMDDSTLKIELIHPKEYDLQTEILFEEEVISTAMPIETSLSPFELGKSIEGSKIRITFTSGRNLDYQVFGISGKDYNFNWVDHQRLIYSKGNGKETILTFTYDDFVNYMGIGDNLYVFAFQNMGLQLNSKIKIELIAPVQRNSQYYVDNWSTASQMEVSPFNLGKEKCERKIRISFISNNPVDFQVIHIQGKIEPENKTIESNRGLISHGVNKKSVYIFNYDDFVTFVGIGDEFSKFRFINWGVSSFKIEVFEIINIIKYT